MSAGVVTSRSLVPSDVSHASQSGAESLSRLRLSAEVRTKATLSVKTREGDTVTLSAGRAARADLTSMAYDRTGRPTAPDLSLQLASAQLNEVEAFEAVVEGDLNEQERRDLDALLTGIDDVAAAFFSGQIGDAVARAFQIQDLGSLQSFRFAASYHMRTFVEHDSASDLVSSQKAAVFPADTSTLTQALEDFFASILQQRKQEQPLSLKALLPSPAFEDHAPEPVDVIEPEEIAVQTPGHEGAPSALSVEHVETSIDDPAFQEFDPAVVSNPAIVEPPKGEEPADQEPPSGATGDTAESKRVVDSSGSDPLAAFAQKIRARIDASGLSSTRLGPYIPSFVHRLVEYRISVLVSSLLP